MKRAYVKPVFVAEKFAAASSYASSACGVSVWNALQIKDGDLLCNTHKNHCSLDFDLGKSNANNDMYTGYVSDPNAENGYNKNTDGNFSFWDYATEKDQKAYLFNSTIGDCDFLWNGDSSETIKVWNSVDKDAADTSKGFIKGIIDTFQSLSLFFTGNESITGNHDVGYNQQSFRS